MNQDANSKFPQQRSFKGLYQPELDSDACGVGMVVETDCHASRRVLDIGLKSLANVVHRGAIGADGKSADGSGILVEIPTGLLNQWLEHIRWQQPSGRVGVGMVFLPNVDSHRERCLEQLHSELYAAGVGVFQTRRVPVCPEVVGPIARLGMPEILQVFVAQPDEIDDESFERLLYRVSRKLALWSAENQYRDFSIASFSKRTMVYKAMVIASKLDQFYPDLASPDFKSRFCIYHQRFSTNTTPEWSLCQPFPMLAHNGEINTIRGNRNWMNARQPSLAHPNWGDAIAELFPITSHDESDSASLNQALRLLRFSGRDVLQSMSILVPPAWQNSHELSQAEKDFFNYQSCFSEPWDGPAAIAFSDGLMAAACLDRNGLRPARYKILKDGLFVLGSEAGADEIPIEETEFSGRLSPGQMIAVELATGKIKMDSEIKKQLAARQDYGQWLRQQTVRFKSTGLASLESTDLFSESELKQRQVAAGLTVEDRDILIGSMVKTGQETTFSMGLDTPLAVLSRRPQLISRYFKQRFAQVTNPPIDSIREKNVMSLAAGIGPERNLLDESPEHCKIIALDHPILFEHELAQVRNFSQFPSVDISCVFAFEQESLQQAIERICGEAVEAVQSGTIVLCLTDRKVDRDHAAIPIQLALGAIHHRLCQTGLRMKCSLVLETSACWGPHQFALLFGFGATAICPYLALQSANALEHHSGSVSLRNYRDAIENGLRKIMAKMGISVLNSYQGAQIFEAIGIAQEVIDTCFCGTRSPIAGAGFDSISRDYVQLHRKAFEPDESIELDHEGRYKPRKDGVRHLINGRVTKSFHRFVRDQDPVDYQSFAAQVSPEDPYSIRDLLEWVIPKSSSTSEEWNRDSVDSIESIRSRFTTAAMSLGAISPEAHEAIAIAMNQIGGKSNSGEGGEDAERNITDSLGQDARSKIKQVASGRFGITPEYLMSADEIEIKMAQGAKPGEGGQLPGFKVNATIAKLRHTDPGVSLISPPPHHDIYSIEDLSQLIYDLKCINPAANVCVKLVAKSGVGNIAVGVAKANADVILISGHEGGTGASPLSSINHAGIPWELGLAETHQALVANGLRERVVLRADGGLKTGRDVVLAAILGAEEFNFGTMALMSLGCVYVKKCHLNNCPVGIATQDEKFRKRFRGQPEHLIRYINAVAGEVQEILSVLQMPSIDSIVGQTQFIRQRVVENHAKANLVDLSRLLQPLEARENSASKKMANENVTCWDDTVMAQVKLAHEENRAFYMKSSIGNTDRDIGSRISGWISNAGWKSGREWMEFELDGSAGQSFGAFLCDGIQIQLTGEANDYVGKSMAGGRLILRAHDPEQPAQVILGNTCLYGATGGKLFAAGMAAERFAIRNSGAQAVIEGCGEHGCEYMTRGTVVILGEVGSNFGAGMTGGLVLVHDPKNRIAEKINFDSVQTATPNESEWEQLKDLITQHAALTGSDQADAILEQWPESRHEFVKVQAIPVQPVAKPHWDKKPIEKLADSLAAEPGSNPS